MFETTIKTKGVVAADSSVSSPLADFNSSAGRAKNLMVPIRCLGENHRARICAHLVALNDHDRYFRFGFTAKDEQIERYVNGIDFERDEVFGIYNRHVKLIAVAHLAYSGDKHRDACCEFGVSVLAQVRGRGYGTRLFERAVMHACNEGVQTMYVHVLSENSAMLKIAVHAGATVVRDGAESEAHLRLPTATFNTHMSEMVEEHLAQADYRIKVHAKQFRQTLGRFQSAWRLPNQTD